jgi:hypothetical protein
MSNQSLHDAAGEGDIERVKGLLKDRADVNARDAENATPLHVASLSGHKSVLGLLLTNDADASARDNDGATPLHLTAIKGHTAAAALLLASRVNVNAKANDGSTPLHVAAVCNESDITAFLLANNAMINARDYAGSTPLHLAAEYGHLEVTGTLLASEANIDARDRRGATPLHVATVHDHKEVVKLLLASRHALGPIEQEVPSRSSRSVDDISAEMAVACPSGIDCEGYTRKQGIPKCVLQRNGSVIPDWYKAKDRELVKKMRNSAGRVNNALTVLFWLTDRAVRWCKHFKYEDYGCAWCDSHVLYIVGKDGKRKQEASLRRWPKEAFRIMFKWYYLRSFVSQMTAS